MASTADIVGTTGASFTFTIDSATIVKANLIVGTAPAVELMVAASGREVTVPSLPAGDSVASLALIWAPGDADATIDVGTVTSGSVTAANPKHTIDLGDTPGFVELFGTKAESTTGTKAGGKA
jgi:hypothetical protein